MEQKKPLALLLLFIIILMAMGIAYLFARHKAPSVSTGYTGRYNHVQSNAPLGFNKDEYTQLQNLKDSEFLGIIPSKNEENSMGKSASYKNFVPRRSIGDFAKYRPNGIRNTTPSAGRNLSARPTNYPTGNRYEHTSFHMPSSAENSFSPTGAVSTGDNTLGQRGIAGVYRPNLEERGRAYGNGVLAPYLAQMTPKQREKMERQLSGLSSGIERAIAKALLPKSKKDQDIDKYFNRSSAGVDGGVDAATLAAAGPFGGVLKQISAQKGSVMQTMGQAFGKSAGKEVGKIMDRFSQDMAAVVTNPNLTDAQKAEATRSLNRKYQKELNDFSEKESVSKFEKERIAQDNQLKNELAKQYGSKIADLAAVEIDKMREKDMALAQAGLPAEEYYKQQLDNQRERRSSIEKILKQEGKSTRGLMAVEDKIEQEQVAQRLRAEEEGEAPVRVYHTSKNELEAFNHSLETESREMIQTATQMYGKEGAEKIENIYKDYHQKYMEIWNNPETSKTEKQQASMELRQGVNNKLNEIQKDPAMKEAQVRTQVDASLNQMMRDPSLQDASPDARENFERKARGVLTNMYRQVNEVMGSDLSDEEKQRRVQQIQQQAQEQLAQ